MTAHELRSSVERAMEAIAEDFLQQRTLFNGDAPVNSVTERVIGLARCGVPEPDIRALLADIGAVLESIDRALEHQRAVCGLLDEYARLAHRAERSEPMRSALDVRSLAKALRAPLRVLRESDDATERLRAEREVRRITAGATRAQLHGSLRNALGKGPHDQLLDLLGLRVGEGR